MKKSWTLYQDIKWKVHILVTKHLSIGLLWQSAVSQTLTKLGWSFEWDPKTEVPCHSRWGLIKIPTSFSMHMVKSQARAKMPAKVMSPKWTKHSWMGHKQQTNQKNISNPCLNITVVFGVIAFRQDSALYPIATFRNFVRYVSNFLALIWWLFKDDVDIIPVLSMFKNHNSG